MPVNEVCLLVLLAFWAGKSSCSLCPSGAYASAGEGMLQWHCAADACLLFHDLILCDLAIVLLTMRWTVWAQPGYSCMPACNHHRNADRPLALQRLRQTNVLSVLLERMPQLKVRTCAARVDKLYATYDSMTLWWSPILIPASLPCSRNINSWCLITIEC